MNSKESSSISLVDDENQIGKGEDMVWNRGIIKLKTEHHLKLSRTSKYN